MAVNLTAIYLHVVADVINNVRADFLSEGVDETVLHELQSLWELNMMQAGTIHAAAPGDIPFARGGGGGHPPITPVHDLNMPYEGETPTAELLFPPTPVHTPLPTFLPPGPSPSKNEYPEAGIAGDVAIGRPTLFMPSPWMNQNPDTSLGMNPKLDMNVAYEGGDEEEAPSGQVPVTKEFLPPSTGKRKREDIAPNYLSGSFFPQHDGAGDILTSPVSLEQASYSVEAKKPLLMEDSTALAAKRNLRVGIDQCKHTEERTLADALMHATVDARRTATHSSIPQFDGIGDNYDDDVAEEDYNEPGEEEQPAADDGDLKPLKLEGAESDGSEPPLNEDDDLDDLDDIDKGDEESKTEHLVLAQFEKVTRSKNKWKCTLKDGIMHLNHRDFLFSRANGEFEF